MDDIEAFLLASAATGIMTAKAKINMAVEIVEIPAWKLKSSNTFTEDGGIIQLRLCLPAVDLARARMYLLVAVVACLMRCDWVQ